MLTRNGKCDTTDKLTIQKPTNYIGRDIGLFLGFVCSFFPFFPPPRKKMPVCILRDTLICIGIVSSEASLRG